LYFIKPKTGLCHASPPIEGHNRTTADSIISFIFIILQANSSKIYFAGQFTT